MPSRTTERPALFGLVDLRVLGEAMAMLTAADPRGEEARRALSLAAMPTRALAELASRADAGGRYDAAASLAERSDAPRLAQVLIASETPGERALGIALIGQLPMTQPLAEVRDVLTRGLSDPSETVVAESALAIAHRADRKLMRRVVGLASHASFEVRLGVSGALAAHVVVDTDLCVCPLIALTTDASVWVRSWATFGLARADVHTDDVVDALVSRASNDDDAEVRGEALEGLASLVDPRSPELALAELERGTEGEWAFHAALSNPARMLVQALRESRAQLLEIGDDDLASLAASALEACLNAPEPIEA